MKYFNGGSGLQLRKFLSITLSIGIILLGVPIKSLAQEVLIGSDNATTPYLREPEKVDCVGLQEKIDRITQDKQHRNETIQKMKDLIAAAKEGRQDAYIEAAKAAKSRGKAVLDDLTTKNLQMISEYQRIRDKYHKLRLDGFMKESQKITDIIKSLDIETDNTAKIYGQLKNVYNVGGHMETFQLAEQASNNAKTMQQLLGELNKNFVESGLAEDLGDAIKDLGGPASIIAFDTGEFLIDVGANLGEAMIDDRDLAKLEESLKTMEAQNQALDFHVGELTRSVGAATTSGNCLTSPSSQASKVAPPPPSETAPPPPKSSGGMGAGGVLLIGAAVAAAAVGIAVAAGGISSSSSSSGSSTCSSRFCIYGSVSHTCDCSGSTSVSCPSSAIVHGAGGSCGSGGSNPTTCSTGLMCVNGVCKSSCP